MTTNYVENANVTQILKWIASGVCMFCGSPEGEGKDRYACFCRYCPSCSSRWKADIRRDMNDGRPSTEECPDCKGEMDLEK